MTPLMTVVDPPKPMPTIAYHLIIIILVVSAQTELTLNNQKLEWIIGSWRSEFSGKVFWPTVPTMTFGEELVIAEAPLAKSVNVQFLNFRGTDIPFRRRTNDRQDHHQQAGHPTSTALNSTEKLVSSLGGEADYE
ncbi:unnamed protein product [Gongylonema pulchrum]|uniref:DUF1794 domain-containing protein n=1 Tax=Gongylonema pulchrum TaxID=637853 RepID=A0A183EG48_9BILA|nr:unnamed protein product [Gongylonema pulchrum]